MENRLDKNFTVNFFIAALWLTSISLETGGQLAIKHAADIATATEINHRWVLQLMGQPWFLLAVLFEVANFAVWMVILRQHDLSLAIPLSSLSYFPIVLAGTIVFKEPVFIGQGIGLLIIGAGIWLVTTDGRIGQET